MSDALNSRSWQRVQHRYPVLDDVPEAIGEAQKHVTTTMQKHHALAERIAADPRLSDAGKRLAIAELSQMTRSELGQLDDRSNGIGRRYAEEAGRATLAVSITSTSSTTGGGRG